MISFLRLGLVLELALKQPTRELAAQARLWVADNGIRLADHHDDDELVEMISGNVVLATLPRYWLEPGDDDMSSPVHPEIAAGLGTWWPSLRRVTKPDEGAQPW